MPSLTIINIPPELLGDIFFQCSRYCPDAPVLLSIVCTHFRSVALSTPRAWTSLRLSVSQGDERDVIRKAGLWLSLAGACCVDLYIDIEGQTTAVAESHQFLVAFLQHNTARIGNLNVRSQTERAAHSFLNALYCPLPFSPSPAQLPLKTLRIRISGDAPGIPAASAASSVFHSLELLPLLKSLQLTNHLLPSVYTPDLHNLQTLSVVRPLRAPAISLPQLLQIIQAAPSLVELEISARIVNCLTDTQYLEVHLPTLKRLSVRTNRLPRLLELLVAPELEHLRLNDLDGKREGASSQLMHSIQVLNRKLVAQGSLNWSLKMLEVIGVELHLEGDDAHTWERCLARMKRLEGMTMTCSDDSMMRLATFLSKDYAGSFPCPALHSLHISGLYSSTSVEALKQRRPNLDFLVDWSLRDQPKPDTSRRLGRGLGFGSRFALQRPSSRTASPDVARDNQYALVPEIETSW